MRKLELFEYEHQLSRRVTEIFKQMAELLQLREFVRLAEDRQGQHQLDGLARNPVDSKIVDQFSNPQLFV